MSSPASRARCVAGALVGVSSATLTAVAHTAAGGSLPTGSPLASLLIVSAAVGATAAAITAPRYDARIAALMTALCSGQLLGHLTLSVGHHSVAPSTSMLAMHVIAAAILGLLIGLVEHVYVVCESVLCWLRLFAVDRCRPVPRLPRTGTTSVVVQSVLLRSGLGMRAPPQGTALGV
jgi:hypothetical protein